MEIIPKKDIIHYKLILKANYRSNDRFYMKCVIPWKGLAASNNYELYNLSYRCRPKSQERADFS